MTRNKEREAASVTALEAADWHVLTVWECETRDVGVLTTRLAAFLGPRSRMVAKVTHVTCGFILKECVHMT
jgi:G:T-mismatch repair DNA endonuclease (very short patch repair protein)